jgi:hypothetical protein
MSAETMTFATLQTDALNYVERTSDEELTTQLPRLVMLAEDWLSRNIRGLGKQNIIRGELTQSDNVLVKPARWRETNYIRVLVAGQWQILRKRTLTFCQQYWQTLSVESVPMYYADYDYDRWFVAATPDDNYTIEVGFYEKPAPLSSEAQENWTTQNAPALLLNATLAEVHGFLKNYEAEGRYRQMASAGAADILQEASRRLSDASANRVEG